MKLLGQRHGFAGGRNREISNQEWIESSIRQSVSVWKDMFKVNKENANSNNEKEKPLTWIDQ